MSNASQNNANRNSSQPQVGREQIAAADASMNSFRMNSFPGGFQAIATAYSDYTRKSFEDTRSFVENLSGVKSVDKAIEIQTDFAKSTFETFMAESQKIGALYRDLAAESCKPFGGFLAQDDPAKSISLTLAMSAKNGPARRGAFFYRSREPAPAVFRGEHHVQC